ncbi:Zinc finger CCCH domain-containing protein 43 [Spatholobus suberectus]|nr:Zinc finger CCCH domain-containing protein 43 [Spatholobus suberectus]
MHLPSTYVMNNPAMETNVYMHHQKQMQVEEFPERPGEPECSYFLKTGDCKFKSNCKFHHPKNRIARLPPRNLSDKGLPLRPPPVYLYKRSLHPPSTYVMNNPAMETNVYMHHQKNMQVEEFPQRPGQPECIYFKRTGDCKFKSNCKFHHPKIRIVRLPPCNLCDNLRPIEEFPESPYQPKCNYFKITEDCKFKLNCIFRHPKNRIPTLPPCKLNDKGLPLRPDKSVCLQYSRSGLCRFGRACRFDHPPLSTMARLYQQSANTNSASVDVAENEGASDGNQQSV